MTRFDHLTIEGRDEYAAYCDEMYDREVIRKMDEERDNAAVQSKPKGHTGNGPNTELPAPAAPKLCPQTSWPFPRSVASSAKRGKRG